MICKWCNYPKEKHNEKDLACPSFDVLVQTNGNFYSGGSNNFKGWLLTSFSEKQIKEKT